MTNYKLKTHKLNKPNGPIWFDFFFKSMFYNGSCRDFSIWVPWGLPCHHVQFYPVSIDNIDTRSQDHLASSGSYEVGRHSEWSHLIGRLLCVPSNAIGALICAAFYKRALGQDLGQLNRTMLPIYLDNKPEVSLVGFYQYFVCCLSAKIKFMTSKRQSE